MPSISEILNGKREANQQRIEGRRAERGQLSAQRDDSLLAVTTNPDLYTQFLVLQADNIGLSAGNIALAMSQMVNPTKIGTTDFWHSQGRFVMDEEMQKGAKVFVPSKNPSFRGYLMGSYYDITQTSGKPMKEPQPLTEGAKLDTAFAAILDTSPVDFVEDTELKTPVRYDERDCVIRVNPEFSKEEVFAGLATEISYARLHNRGQNRDYDRQSFQLTAESIGFMVCRRFGVDCPLPNSDRVAQAYEYYEPEDRGKALDFMRQTARNMGDTVDKSIQPRKQELGNNRGSTHRNYGRR